MKRREFIAERERPVYSFDRGRDLNSAKAAARLTQFGPNLIHGERKRALVLQFPTKFRNPLVIDKSGHGCIRSRKRAI
jgi:hypothetical protein